MVTAPSERTKAQRDNVFLFMRADVSHKFLHDTTLFFFVLYFEHSIQPIKLLCYGFFLLLPVATVYSGRAAAKNRARLIRDAHPGDGRAANDTYAWFL